MRSVIVVDGLAYGSMLFIAAAGLILTFGVARVLNLAHGVLVLAGAYLAWLLVDGTWLGLLTAVLVSTAVGAAAGGGLAGLLPFLPRQLDQAVATVGLGLLAGYTLTAAFGHAPLSVAPPGATNGVLRIAGTPYPVYRLLLVGFAVVVAVAMWWVLHRTRPGLLARAAGQSPTLLALSGINPRTVQVGTVAIGSALAGTAGVLIAPVTGPTVGLDHRILVVSLVIVIAGGMTSILGTGCVALVIGQIQTVGLVLWPAGAPYLPYALLVGVLSLRYAVGHRLLRRVVRLHPAFASKKSP